MLASIKGWINQPFNSNMSAQKWLAFVGLLLAIMIFWRHILRNFE